MNLLATLATGAWLAAAPALSVAPGEARPGDLLMVSVPASSAVPSGTLEGKPLRFFRLGSAWRALSALSVDETPRAANVDVRFPDGRTEAGWVEILEAVFRRRQLGVSRAFTSPSKAARARMKADNAAFAKAYAQPWSEPLFTRNFQWPRAAEVTAPFGDRRLFNGQLKSQHMGTDLDGRTGDPIHAANDGVVVLARDCFATGNTVLLHHGVGLYTAYFHLSRLDVAVGQKVKRGELLGGVGATGRVTGAHLHWGVKYDGRYVDGESLLRLDFER
ncbi:MAG: hypothetical protein RL653_4019 [Pseudomonadota bacterium]|jgi:murein DD-endopeptidase MepM/ murein hydrolase activator NlpD